MSNHRKTAKVNAALLCFSLAGRAFAAPDTATAIQTLEFSHAALKISANAPNAKMAGACAATQLGLPLSAAYFLRRMTVAEWAQATAENITCITPSVLAVDRFPADLWSNVPAERVAAPLGTTFRLQRSRELLREENYSAARALLGPLVSKKDPKAAPSLLLARIALRDRNVQLAQNWVNTAADPTMQDLVHMARARLHFAQLKYTEAVKEYRLVSNSSPSKSRANLEKAYVELVSKNPVAAKASATDAEDDAYLLDELEAKLVGYLAGFQGSTPVSVEAITETLNDAKKAAQTIEANTPGPSQPLHEIFQNRTGGPEPIAAAKLQIKKASEEIKRLENQKPIAEVSRFLATQLKDDMAAAERGLIAIQNRLFLETSARIRRLTRDLLAARSEAYFRSGQLELAVKDLEDARAASQEVSTHQDLRLATLRWALAATKDTETAGGLRLRAIQTFEALSLQMDFAEQAEATFLVGVAHKAMGRPLEAAGAFSRLTQRYPGHSRIVESHLFLGDLAFDRGDFRQAQNQYRKVLSSASAEILGYANFRLAWALRLAGETQLALTQYEKTLAWANQWEKNAFAKDLEQNARQDLLSLYADSGDLKEATAYFNRWKESESAVWLRDLAKELENSGQFEQAERLYRFLAITDPTNHNTVFSDSAKVLSLAEKLGAWDRWAETLESYRSGPLSLAKQTTSPDVSNLEAAIRSGIVALAAKKNPAKQTDTAISTYLDFLGDRPQAEAVWFLRAEREKQNHRWKEASATLRNYLQKFSAHIDHIRKEEVMRELVDTLQKQEKDVPPSDGPLASTSLELVEAAEPYLAAFPNNRHTRSIQILTAQTYLKHKQWEKGIALYQRVLDFNAQDAFAQTAFDALRAAYYTLGTWEKTHAWANELSSRRLPGMEKFKPALTTIRMESLFLWAEKTVEPVTSAKLYLDALRHLEMRPIWEKSLYNAAVRVKNAKLQFDFLKICDRLEKEFPDSVHLTELAPARAAIYHEAGDFVRSLPPLLYYLGKNPAPSEGLQQARLNAALVLEAQAKNNEARDLLNLFVKSTPAPSPAALEEAQRAMTRIATLEGRALNSIPETTALIQRRIAFEKAPLGAKGQPLAVRIRNGGMELESLAKGFLKASEDPSTPSHLVLESVCSIAMMYDSYENELGRNAPQDSPKLAAEIQKIRPPLAAKAKEFGRDCLKIALEREADGNTFRRANQKWGWEWDPILAERVRSLVSDLNTVYPAWDTVATTSEESIIDEHLSGKVSETSWYALTRIRCARGLNHSCRLTLSRAMELYPHSGKILNGYATLNLKTPGHEPLAPLFLRASKHGSPTAMSNLAFYHLREGRWAAGREALTNAYKAHAFEGLPLISGRIKEMVQK